VLTNLWEVTMKFQLKLKFRTDTRLISQELVQPNINNYFENSFVKCIELIKRVIY